ncbi:DUF192 domain-containing protein [Salibacterium aidingense]|uniref:DUF192 domain-containing protein n=1 Tax=Salibacterium aidingense TaxID=384933 RepID=UPI003BE6DFC1
MIINTTTSETIPLSIHWAETRRQRIAGLMGKKSFSHAALVLPDCEQIHTAFMRFPIDVFFINREGHVLDLEKNLKPWRISKKVKQTSFILETAAGVTEPGSMRPGDHIVIQE